jgi:hypothetical protein
LISTTTPVHKAIDRLFKGNYVSVGGNTRKTIMIAERLTVCLSSISEVSQQLDIIKQMLAAWIAPGSIYGETRPLSRWRDQTPPKMKEPCRDAPDVSHEKHASGSSWIVPRHCRHT